MVDFLGRNPQRPPLGPAGLGPVRPRLARPSL